MVPKRRAVVEQEERLGLRVVVKGRGKGRVRDTVPVW